MITQIKAIDFKGLEFTQDLKDKNLIIGDNGTGKSARIQALLITAMGYVPGIDKINRSILEAFGKGDQFYAGCMIKNTTFIRQFKRDKKGAVSQNYMVDTRKVAKDKFIGTMSKMGGIAVFDLTSFMDLSDQGKINLIFDLFPPAGDIEKLNDQIKANTYKLNSAYADVRDTEKFIGKISTARAEINLPAGTLAEVSAEIKSTQNELDKARDDLKKAQIELAEQQAKERSDAEAKKKSSASVVDPLAYPETQEVIHTGSSPSLHFSHNPAESIRAIIDTIVKVGCPVCSKGAALMVAKREIKKYQTSEVS
jgi:exonuclease SbcC